MKLILKILGVIAALILVLLIVALFTKKGYFVEREVTINRASTDVFAYIKILKNQDHYSKWVMMDPNAKKEYIGTDGTVGFVATWDSENKNVGKGEQEIKNLAEGQRMDLEVRFIKPFASVAPAYMTTEAIGAGQTRVKWGFTGRMPYPMNLMLLFMPIDKMIGDDLQTGLNNLKGVLEK